MISGPLSYRGLRETAPGHFIQQMAADGPLVSNLYLVHTKA